MFDSIRPNLGPALLSYEMNAKKSAPLPYAEDCEETLAEKFVAAVQEHKEKTLRGLNALTEADIEEEIAEFIAEFGPGENATEAEIAAFAVRLALFVDTLRMHNENVERLIVPSGSSADNDGASHLVRSRIQSAQSIQIPPANIASANQKLISKTIGNYEQSLATPPMTAHSIYA